MSCPNCGEKFKKVEFDHQFILHCPNCGCSFFEQNGINRITLKSARKLAWDKKQSFVKGEQLACPLDNSMMILIENDAIPRDVTLLRCPSCYGLFAHPEDLLKFKRAQNIKIRFFKVWSKPMPSLQAVLVMGFIGFMILMIALSMVNLKTKQLTTTSAQDQITNIYAKQTTGFIFFSFKTSQPYRSSVKFTDKNTGKTVVLQASENYNTLHTVTISELNPRDEIYYQILLEDKHGDKLTTEETRLPIQ
jgi:hypothetical protein